VSNQVNEKMGERLDEKLRRFAHYFSLFCSYSNLNFKVRHNYVKICYTHSPCRQKDRAINPVQLFHPCLIFKGKARRIPIKWSTIMSSMAMAGTAAISPHVYSALQCGLLCGLVYKMRTNDYYADY
jgi:hypothetical protein